MHGKNKNINSIAIIDSIEGYKEALNYNPDILVTDNTLLYETLLLSCKSRIINTDSAIQQKDINRWGKLFIDWGLSVDMKLNEINPSINYYQEAGTLSMFILALMCRVEGLLRKIKLDELQKVIIVYSDNSMWYESSKHSRLISPYPFLAKNKFFGNSKVILKKLQVNYIANLNYSETNSIFLRLSSSKVTENLIWKLVQNKYFNFNRAETVIKGDSEIIRQYLFKIFLNGILPISYKNVIKNYSTKSFHKKQLPSKLKKIIRTFIKNKLNENFNFKNYEIISIVNFIVLNLEENINIFLKQKKEIDYFFYQLKNKFNRIKSVIVSAPNGSSAKYFHHLAKKKKIKVINFEHGLTTGLSRRNKYYMNYSEATNCDHMMVINELAKKDYQLNKISKIAELSIIGMPKQITSIKNNYIQNIYIRKKYGFNSYDCCICHVSTLMFNGGIRYGPDTITDKNINEFNYKILSEVYNKLNNKKIIFKDYPSLRHTYQPNLKDRIKLNNKNIFFEEDGDWRYLRAISNIIVTMAKASTLAWCIGSKVPIVFLDIPHMKFRHSWMRESFKKSFFFIDIGKSNWTKELKKLLLQPLEETQYAWKEKEYHRNDLIDNYLFPNKRQIISLEKIKKLIHNNI